MDRTCPACSARLDQHATRCPNCGADLAASGTDQSTEAGAAGEAVRNTAAAAHLSTFAGLVI
ncbi:MAG TPA: zinc-ribbon domain-containing protein, partial [Actinomycetes bacterium]|nr:zinc-ribbon domain-containing protein [Actinomycetes bacterium]